jgi:hypothetical protein
VAMAAFPNQYIATSVNSNGPDLDSGCIDPGPGICVAETVNAMAQATYPGRYIIQRNNVSAIIPLAGEASDAWAVLVDAANNGMPVAGQALSNCFNDTSYQMNGGNNCNLEDPNCATPTPTPTPTPTCTGSCVITFQQELDQSGAQLHTYNASYYEVYYLDAANLSLANLHTLFTGSVGCATPTPTPTATPTATPTPIQTCATPTATPTPIQTCATPTATPTPTPTCSP